VNHLDDLFLAHADGSRLGLFHHRTGPPGAHEDDPVEFLEVEATAAGLELDQEDVAQWISGSH
jgi:hypothetical protein